MSSHTSFCNEKHLTQKLEELRQKPYLPESLITLVDKVMHLLIAMEPLVRLSKDNEQKLPQEVLTTLPVMAVHQQGVSLLPRDLLPLDMSVAEKTTKELLRSLGNCAPELEKYADKLEKALQEGTCTLAKACKAVLSHPGNTGSDDESYFTAWEQEYPEAPNFFHFIAQTAVMPSAIVAGRLLAPYHDASKTWLHGHCPICGSLPLIGRFKDGEGMRMHTCSFCLFEYRVPRIGCPFCLETNPEHSQYLTSADEPGYQIHTCTTCKSYIKIADFRQFDRKYIPTLDDLQSLILDLYARKEGFVRPTFSAWGF